MLLKSFWQLYSYCENYNIFKSLKFSKIKFYQYKKFVNGILRTAENV